MLLVSDLSRDLFRLPLPLALAPSRDLLFDVFFDPLRVRLAILNSDEEPSPSPDDSSKDRFGERWERRSIWVGLWLWLWLSVGGTESEPVDGVVAEDVGNGGRGRRSCDGDGERDVDLEAGREVVDGVVTIDIVQGVVALDATADASLRLTFRIDFFFGVGVGGSTWGGISSSTDGRPECGPRRLRMDEKCSQS